MHENTVWAREAFTCTGAGVHAVPALVVHGVGEFQLQFDIPDVLLVPQSFPCRRQEHQGRGIFNLL
ncbi:MULTISPECIES: hypothetical protein [Micrococcaceae]|uniref:hypothetical protein n=1 Tax=Micrococcaceae TaxID=1268 RepID=UPI0006F72F45|nr:MULTISPECIES: hypothetical protein [Micrococcaceae]KRE77681.1 hypothetical protein ASG79_00195 [Arthrobacter sp. Soil761]MBD1591283.1 hypothetical protein [Arthrobacter sp. S1_S22]